MQDAADRAREDAYAALRNTLDEQVRVWEEWQKLSRRLFFVKWPREARTQRLTKRRGRDID